MLLLIGSCGHPRAESRPLHGSSVMKVAVPCSTCQVQPQSSPPKHQGAIYTRFTTMQNIFSVCFSALQLMLHGTSFEMDS